MTAADLVIEDLAAENADLREAKRQLVDLVADLAYNHAMLEFLYERERLSRLHGEAAIARLYRLLHARRQDRAA